MRRALPETRRIRVGRIPLDMEQRIEPSCAERALPGAESPVDADTPAKHSRPRVFLSTLGLMRLWALGVSGPVASESAPFPRLRGSRSDFWLLFGGFIVPLTV